MRFDLLFGVAVGDGLGEAFFRFGEVSGDGVGVGFFFRCLRLGVGDGSKTFLIFVPSDSWTEGAASTAPNNITRIRSHFIIRRRSVRCPQRRFERHRPAGCAEDSARYSSGREISARVLGEWLCSNECRLRNFLEENFRWANGHGNLAAPVPTIAFRPREFPGIRRQLGCCPLRV